MELQGRWSDQGWWMRSERQNQREDGLMEMMIWNVILTGMVAIMGFLLKEKFSEINRLGILLNRTREEVARDHITRAEVRADMERILEHVDNRFNRLETRLEEIIRKN
jgi:hypothetical protein